MKSTGYSLPHIAQNANTSGIIFLHAIMLLLENTNREAHERRGAMSQQQEPGNRIVSQGEYEAQQAQKVILLWAAIETQQRQEELLRASAGEQMLCADHNPG